MIANNRDKRNALFVQELNWMKPKLSIVALMRKKYSKIVKQLLSKGKPTTLLILHIYASHNQIIGLVVLLLFRLTSIGSGHVGL